MAIRRTKETISHEADTEEEATALIDDFKARANKEGYTVTKTKVDYKTKKDRKTGEITEEWYNVEVTYVYD
jgi:hypothetical protein